MRYKKDPLTSRGALKCEVRRIEPRKPKMKKCFVNIEKQDTKLHLNVNFRECDKVPVVVKSERRDQSTSCNRHSILKPFNTILRLGDVSFTSDDPVLKLSEKENAPKPPERITRSYRRKIRNDIYEFTSQSEEDCDPTVDVVKKMINEGRAKLVKRKPGKQNLNRKPKDKSISECVRSVERYRRRSYTKILRERNSNCQGAYNQQSEDSTHEQNLSLDEFHDSRNFGAVDLNDNVQNRTEEVDSSKSKKSENIKILEVLILPNKAIIKPMAILEDEKPEEAIDPNAAVEFSEEICDTADTPRDGESGSEIFLNQDDYLFNEEIDYFNLSRISESSSAKMDSCSVDVNSTAKTLDSEPINISICGNNETSTQMDSCSVEADLEIYEPKSSFAQTDSSVEAKTTAKAPEPKPIRKAFWEIEDPEETLDKSLIKKTYSRQKPKEPRSHFFIFFSDEDSKKSHKSTKENASEYYTRSKIQNWMESTKFETKKGNKLDAKQTNKVKKAILKQQNKISDSRVNLKLQQKPKREKNKINKKIKEEKPISSSSKTRGRGFRQLRPVRL